jgi:hypothetical protein
MSGIVNKTGAKSGVIGTTVGSFDLTTATFPADHIIKIESIIGSGNHDLSGVTAMTATGLKTSITFTAGNKILVIAAIQVASWGGGDDTGQILKLRDNTNSVDLSPIPYMYAAKGHSGSTEIDIESSMTLVSELYAPSGTTIEIELYQENPWSAGGAGTPVARVNKSRSTLQLMEVQV